MESATLIVNGKKAMVLEGHHHTFATVANSYKGFQIKAKGQYAEMMKAAENHRTIAKMTRHEN